MYFTSGDDNTILLYSGMLKKCIGSGEISTVTDIKTLPKKKKRGGASSMSNKHPHQQARALDYCEALKHLAVGHNDGCVSIR
jgi:WD40 repeat protein